MPGMNTPQAGIFALGTSSHAYLEFDIQDAKKGKEFAATIAAIREPRTTTGGVNLVIGFRPELWRDIVPEDAPAGVEGFNKEIQGLEGFVMPSTPLHFDRQSRTRTSSISMRPATSSGANRKSSQAEARYGV